MLIVALFITLSALLIVATPLPANHRPTVVDSDSRITLYRRAPLKFEIRFNQVGERHRKDTIEKMKKHYETESTDEQRRAGLASVISRWKKDLQPGREYMNFNYHTGDTTGSPVIPPTATIYRDKPAPKTHFLDVLNDHREEMELEVTKRYNDLNPDSAHRVGSMKVWHDWHLNGGIREKTQFTFHSSVIPVIKNIIGEPTTITRPLTLQFPELPSWDRVSIDHQVRAAHRKMIADPQHPAATANYGTVHSNWHDSLPDANGETHKQVIVGLEEVSEKERKHLGNFAVRASTRDLELIGSNAGGPSSHTAAGTSHAGPSRVNSKVARPLNSQGQRYDSSSESSRTLSLNSGSPHTLSSNSLSPHTLSPNSGSSHLTRQGSQFDVGGPSLHSGPSHPELLHASSPQQPLHPGLYSDKLWDADSPRLQSSPPNRHPNSPPSQFRAENPKPSRPGPSHRELMYPGLSQQPLQPHNAPLLRNEFDMQLEPESQPSKGLHPGLYTDPLWHTGSSQLQFPPPNNQMPFHPNSLPSQVRAGNPDPSSRPPDSGSSRDIWQGLHAEHPSLFKDPIWYDDSYPQSPSSVNKIPSRPTSPSLRLEVSNPGPSRPGPSNPVLPQQSLQSHTGNQPVHNEFNTEPESHPSQGTWHPSLHSGQLSHTDSSHPEFLPSDQILPRPNSPPLHPDAWSPRSAQSINTVLPNQPPSPPPPPQVGPSPSPSESTHPDADLSPEIWHLLNPDPVYPYPWNPHQHNP